MGWLIGWRAKRCAPSGEPLGASAERGRERVGCNDAFGLAVYGAVSYGFPDQLHLGTNFPSTGTFELLWK